MKQTQLKHLGCCTHVKHLCVCVFVCFLVFDRGLILVSIKILSKTKKVLLVLVQTMYFGQLLLLGFKKSS